MRILLINPPWIQVDGKYKLVARMSVFDPARVVLSLCRSEKAWI